MKMITAIVHRNDVAGVSRCLSKEGFGFTKMSTSGGFLRNSNVTLIIGVEDEKVDLALDLIRKNCSRRMEAIPASVTPDFPSGYANVTEIPVGGAIVFVTDVVKFEKM